MSKYLKTYEMFSILMGEEKTMSTTQKLLVLIHSINKENKLICIYEDQECQYPTNWRNQYEDTYSFTYRNDKNHTILNVRATERGEKLEIIFSQVASTQSYRVLLLFSDSVENNASKYNLTLQEYFKESQTKGSRMHINRQQNKQVNLPIHNTQGGSNMQFSQQNVGYPPKKLINQPNFINNPFGQEEYVGPNSQIFANPYQNQQPFPGSLRIPPGARYDKIDPFDNPLADQRQGPSEFFGFDEFGRPRNGGMGLGGRSNRGGFGGFGGFGGGWNGI